MSVLHHSADIQVFKCYRLWLGFHQFRNHFIDIISPDTVKSVMKFLYFQLLLLERVSYFLCKFLYKVCNYGIRKSTYTKLFTLSFWIFCRVATPFILFDNFFRLSYFLERLRCSLLSFFSSFLI